MSRLEKLGDILRDALQKSETTPPLEDIAALFPHCLWCGEGCNDEDTTVLASEKPYRIAHAECQREHDAKSAA